MTRVFAFSHDVPPRRSRAGRASAGVFLDQIEALDRYEQLVLAGITQLEKFLRSVGSTNPELFQSSEFADAMVHVDDQIAGFQIPKVREERPRNTPTPFGRAMFFLEDVGLGVNLQRRIRQPEPARQRAHGHKNGRGVRVFNAVNGNSDDFVFLQNLDRPLGATFRFCDEHHGVATAAGCMDLGDPVRHTASELHRGLAGHLSGSVVNGELFETGRACTRSSISFQWTRDSSGGRAVTCPRLDASPKLDSSCARTFRACSCTCRTRTR